VSVTPKRLMCFGLLVVAGAAAAVVLALPGADRPARAVAIPVAARSAGAPLLQRLSPQELAGQRIVYAYAGLTPPNSLLAAIRAGEAGGVIFFGPNVASWTRTAQP
jgi:beta-N-acetylhexosaminidase